MREFAARDVAPSDACPSCRTQLRRVVERHISENMRSLPSSVGTAPAAASQPPRAASMGGEPSEAPGFVKPKSAGDVPYATTGPSGSPLPPPPVFGDSVSPRERNPPPPPPPDAADGQGTALVIAVGALQKARLLAVEWQSKAKDDERLRRCWRALVDVTWEGRMLKYHEAAHVEATAARSAEIAELNAANARIAKLAFAQAGKSADEASEELREILACPRIDSSKEARLREQIERLLARDAKQKEAALKQRAMGAFKMALAATAGGVVGGDGAADPDAGTKLEAANAKIDKLTKLVEDLTAEVEELTADLIAAKLGQAELANAGLMLAKEKRQIEKQLVVEHVEMHEIDYQPKKGSKKIMSRASHS